MNYGIVGKLTNKRNTNIKMINLGNKLIVFVNKKTPIKD